MAGSGFMVPTLKENTYPSGTVASSSFMNRRRERMNVLRPVPAASRRAARPSGLGSNPAEKSSRNSS